MRQWPKREIIGTPVSIVDYADVLDAIDAAIAERERIFICCAPASTLVGARDDQALRAALAVATIVTADGMPAVWLARALGEDIRDRVYGPDLMLMHCERAAASGQTIWLYGGFDEDALTELRDALTARFPDLRIAGSWSPPHRPLTATETDDVVARINADAPDVVWVGLGSPKQELWMHELRGSLEAPVLCGVGAAFDFHAGRVAQAPSWMQRHGLEWAYRLAREPARLGPRYLKTNPRFAVLAVGQYLRERRR
jgi:N-acetylglucosaminyldiphosphoundecaprenol N-acetyl-beta-D-mannosaminyltransferase